MTAARHRWAGVFSVLAGAALLAWPALWNGYPILFSDTHAFLVQAGQPRMVWDKPWIYGPFLRALHWNTSLWGPLAGQALLMSYLLFLCARVLGRGGAWRHGATCAVLAAASTAPWFVSLLMPDLFAPATVLCLFMLSRAALLSPVERAVVIAIGTVAVASHLSHLPLAAAVLAALAVQRRPGLASVPLAAALGLLVATNLVGFGRFAVSPYGSVFALARLVADGPGADTIRAECPHSGWRLCAWAARLPTDSDAFLWDADGPVWSDPAGPAGLAAEAGTIVRLTVLRAPRAVASAVLGNAWRQLGMVKLGDTLGPDWLDASVLGSLQAWFPPAETRHFHAGRQMRGTLKKLGEALNPWNAAVMAAAALATLAIALRGHRPVAGLALLVMLALLVNAGVTGGLSRPNDRYQARIAWLLLLPPLFAVPDYRRALRAA